MMYDMDISTARRDLAKLVARLPPEGIPLERYGKVVAILVRPEYAPEVVGLSAEDFLKALDEPKPVKTRRVAQGEPLNLRVSGSTFTPPAEKSQPPQQSQWQDLPADLKKTLAQTKAAQQARDDLLRRINK